MRLIRLLLIGFAGVSAVVAQTKAPLRAQSVADVTTPGLGFIADGSTAGIRPVLGLKAFPALGSRLQAPPGAKRMLLAAGQEYALVETPDAWTIVPVRDTRIREGTVLAHAASLAAISPSGTAAAFYVADTGKVIAIADLPASPRVAFESDAGESVTCLAIADSADVVLAGRLGSVLVLRPDQPVSATVQAGAPAAIAFLRNSRRAFMSDSELGHVISIEVSDSSAVATLVAGRDHGVNAPSALAVDDAGANVLVADGRSIHILSLADGSARNVQCDFQPAHIAPLMESRVFAVRGPDDAGAWVLRLDGSEPRVLYAPALD